MCYTNGCKEYIAYARVYIIEQIYREYYRISNYTEYNVHTYNIYSVH